MAAECCECGTTHKLKKVYRSVITFKPVTSTKYDFCTVCQDVLAPTSTCSKCCGHGCQCGETVDCGCCDTCGDECQCGDTAGCGGGACDHCGKQCGRYGDPKTITVPVAVQQTCETYTRLVPCVTWVVECKCVECCKKCKDRHCCLDCFD